MSEPAPETEPSYPWLPVERVRRWLKLMPEVPGYEVEDVREAAADWIQDQRKDLFVTVGEGDAAVTTFQPTPAVVQAAVLAAARLWSRMGSPAGLASFAEYGAAEVLRTDPDVTRLVRTGKPVRVG